MKITNLIFTVFTLLSTTLIAQKTTKTITKTPVSIYTISNVSIDKNGFYEINKRLKLSNFDFVIVNAIDLDLNQFSINTKHLTTKPSEFIYDDYKRYQDQNLLKGFLLKNDPTRWNLQCRQPNLHL